MKVKTAVKRVWYSIQWVSQSKPITHDDYLLASKLLKKYQLKFGRRHFNKYLRTTIKNGIWETGELE